MKLVKSYYADEIHVGMEDSFDELISRDVITNFSTFSGDLNPLHNDNDFAKEVGKPGIVAHGAIQQCLISRFAGMYLPGKFCILKKIETQYLNPIYSDQNVKVHGVVKKWSAKNLDGELEIIIKDNASSTIYSINRVRFSLTVGASTAEIVNPVSQITPQKINKDDATGKRILLVGGTGGLGQEIKELFQNNTDYEVFVAGRNADISDMAYDPLRESGECVKVLSDFCESKNINAVLFLASKLPLKQSLTEMNLEDFLENVRLHFKPLRDLSANLKSGANQQLKRLIVIGSSWSRDHFFEYGFESYAYTKLLIKLYAQDLSRELARVSGLTINVISPSEISVGMNSGMSDRAMQIMGAKLPTGTMTTTQDVFNSILTLLDEKSSMIKGQEFVLSGGRVK